MRHLFTAFLLLAGLTAALAQNRTLRGTVTDASGQPLPGATVAERGTNNGTVTDGTGNFVLQTRTASPVLVVSSVGFETQTVTPGGETLTIRLAEAATSLQAVQVVGSRNLNRSPTETVAPVDIINIRDVTTKTGQLDVNQLLQFVAPSFNSNRQSGSDGADHVDPATLRGLGPDQTLVLVNGKRRHQSSLVNLFGTRGRGNTGTDLNAIPAAAIERIEILRDGAAAQYGSDAIAGVINIVLKTSINEFTGNVNYGAYQARFRRDDQQFDGGNLNLNGNYGFGVGKGGFVNLTADYNRRQHTNRAAVLPDDQLARRQFGDPKLTNTAVYLNAKLPVSAKAHVYAFGGLNARRGEAYAWTRFADDDRNVPSLYPNGFDPLITSTITDASGAVGVRGTWRGWDVDLGNSFGSNRFHYGVKNTLNSSLGDRSPTSFDAGGFQLQQNVTGLHFSRYFKRGQGGSNIAFGSEFRVENYLIFAGEPGSYTNYNPAKATGSQGFPGFRPSDAINKSRNNFGVYVDTENDLTRAFTLGLAARYERYSDFGGTLNGKLSARVKLGPALALRGTVGTGFRAPSLAQIYFNSNFTNFENAKPVEVLLARNGSAITQKLGIPPLKQETSTNVSLGLTGRLGSRFTFTLDGYYVKVRDRVVLTDYFDTENPVIGPDLAALGVSKAQFFANSISTSTLGLDAVLAHSVPLGRGRLSSTLAANFNRLTVDAVNTTPRLEAFRDTYFGPREQAFVKASAPPSKINLTFDYTVNRLTLLLRFVRFDRVTLINYDGDPQTYDPRTTTDLTLAYALTNHLRLSLGSSNLGNIYPNRFDPQTTESGGAWDPVQMGSNGRFYFARLGIRF